MLWQNIFLVTLVALHFTLHLSVVALKLASLFICFHTFIKASQEFQMLSRVTIYRSVTMNVELLFLMVRIVISVTEVTSLKDRCL